MGGAHLHSADRAMWRGSEWCGSRPGLGRKGLMCLRVALWMGVLSMGTTKA